MNSKTKIIMLIIFVSICVFSGYQIFNYFKEENANKKLNDELKNIAVTINEDSLNQDISEEEKENIIPITVDFDKLRQENKDTVRMDIFKGFSDKLSSSTM